MAETDNSHLRLDKWLWAARFFKTRSLAAAAIVGGKVKLNGERVKAAKAVRLDDELSVHIGPYEYMIRVLDLSGRRGPAPAAALLYAESAQSKAAREKLATRLTAEKIYGSRGKGRPAKRARRQIIRFKKNQDGMRQARKITQTRLHKSLCQKPSMLSLLAETA